MTARPSARRLAALAQHPPPAELAYLSERIGAAATLALIEAHGGTQLKLPKGVNQGSALARSIGLEAGRALSDWRGGERVKIPLCKWWRIRIYAAEGESKARIARRLGVSEGMVYQQLQLVRGAPAPASGAAPGQLSLFPDA